MGEAEEHDAVVLAMDSHTVALLAEAGLEARHTVAVGTVDAVDGVGAVGAVGAVEIAEG